MKKKAERLARLALARKAHFKTAAIIALYALLLAVTVSSTLFDDLGFDFAGYALRYKFAFDGWIGNLLLGLPASTFDGFLPALLPLFFRALGAGFFTLPLMLSIFVLRAIVPLLFIPLGRIFGFGKKSSILLGLIFVLNPILFKFFNRYYEFAGWLFFVLWFAFFYKFLEAKQFNRLLFAASVASASLLVLSHTAPLFFLAIAALFLIRSKRDLERAITVGLLTAGLTAFWLLPFFSYQQLSMVSVQSGMELQSLGIQAAGFLLLLLLVFSTILLHKVRGKQPRAFWLSLLSTLLSTLVLAFPMLPILSKPFAHSYHAFFIFVLLVSFMALRRGRIINRKNLVPLLAIALVALLALSPVVLRQYFFEEPRFSKYEFNGTQMDFSRIDALLQKIPSDSRYEAMPSDPIISAYSTFYYDSKSLLGWGYNVYALKDPYALGQAMVSMKLSCQEFNEGIKKTATNYWLALDASAMEYLKECGLETKEGFPPALFETAEKLPLAQGAKLVSSSNTKIQLLATEETVIIKQNVFPRWKATVNGKEAPIVDLKPGMLVKAQKGDTIELVYSQSLIDWLGIALSIFTLLLLLYAFWNSRRRYLDLP